MKDVKINLNDFVKVVLTQKGADELNRIYDTKKHFDRELYETQLWLLILDLGKLIQFGSYGDKMPFSPNIYFQQEVTHN